MFNSSPSKKDFSYLDVVWIPCSGSNRSPMRVTLLPLIEIDTTVSELEASLPRVPIIRHDYCYTFKWAHRTLVKLPAEYLGPSADEWEDEYMMYVCLDEKAGLPLNEYLQKLNDASDVKVYGDAFIFKQQSAVAVKAKKRSRYLEDFVEDADRLYDDPNCEAAKTLRKLLKASSSVDRKLSSTKVLTHLKGIRIPCNVSYTNRIDIKEMPLVSIGISTDKCDDLEARLGRVPSLGEWESPTFNWNRRSLVKLPSKDKSPSDEMQDADYLMYLCLDEGAKLPSNRYVEALYGVPVFGDAFIFRMEHDGFDESGRAKYVHMEEGLALDAKSLWGRDTAGAAQVLRKLLESSKGDKEFKIGGREEYYSDKFWLLPEDYN